MAILGSLLGIGNKLLERFSPEQRKVRRRNAIDRLREKRAQVVFNENLTPDKRSSMLTAIDKRMSVLRKQAENE